MSIDPSKLLASIPPALRDPLVQAYQEIASNFLEHRWGPAELEGGKFCECVYWILHGSLTGSYAAAPSKPGKMLGDCRALENLPATGRPGDRSLRLLIPRMLPVLYDVRNNRGVGHVGGEVDPNTMDASAVYSMASWILAELVRVFHAVPVAQAQAAVDALVERKIPIVWDPGTVKRVLDTGIPARDECLVLLYRNPSWVSEDELFNSIEYSTMSMFKKNVLTNLHGKRMIEYDKVNKRAKISPKGSAHVETSILKTRP